jgi:proteasome assembly chaperone (PAC2) family protein
MFANICFVGYVVVKKDSDIQQDMKILYDNGENLVFISGNSQTKYSSKNFKIVDISLEIVF